MIMHRLISQSLKLILAIPGSFAVCGHAALATGPGPDVVSTEAADLPKQNIVPLVFRDDACTAIAASEKAAIGCAFGNTTLGMDYSLNLDAESHKFVIRALAAREAEGALSLDRLMFARNEGLAKESSLAGLVVDVSLFHGRVEFESSWAWSEKWLAQHEASLLFPDRQELRRDTAQSHKLVIKPIDQTGVRWALNAEYAHAGDEYWAGRFSSHVPIFALAGSRINFSSSLSVNKWRFAGSVQRQNSLFAQTDTRKLKASMGGLSFNLTDQVSAIAPTAQYPTLPQARTVKRAIGLEIDLYTLMPDLASDSSFPAALIPNYSTLSFEQRATSLIENGSRFQRKSFDFTGMWDSALGDTFINYRIDHKSPLVGATNFSDDTMVYVSQSFPWDDWRFGIDVIKTTSRSGVGRGELSNSLSLGGSVRYSRPNGPEFRLRVGRDSSTFEQDLGDITNRDFGFQVHALLDVTNWLRKRFERNDINLTMEYRYRMREGQFKYELFEGFLETEREGIVRGGFLIHLGMQLP